MINAVYNVAHFVKSVSLCARFCVCAHESMFAGKRLAGERIRHLFLK